MEFRLLGPVEVRVGERVLVLGRPQQRVLVAALAVDAGRPVTVQTLVDRVWDEPPAGARRTLHVLVTRLRRVVEQAGASGEAVRVAHQAGGYALQVDPERVDLLRFRRLVARAREPQCPDGTRVGLLRDALELWRGEPLSGLAGRWPARVRQSLSQQHLDVVVAWARAELQAGDPATVVGPLAELAGEHGLAESLVEVLMRALQATGRQAEALTRYEQLRRRLADELGVDPGPDLRALHRQILGGDPGLPREAAGAGAQAVPRQLPAVVAHFAGRSRELAALTGLARERTAAGGPVIVSAIGGMAGVGKTALAVHWANQVSERFPDGQLYVNLRGFDPTGSVMQPVEALRRFLEALGVPPQRIPADPDAQAALYRTELARRRVLILLDNARDTAQVRPLLPGAAGCLVVVTSRNQLSGLVAAEGAHAITLDLLPPAEARDMLARRLGHDRLAAEPGAVDQILTRCARLPIALAIVAARAATQPGLSLAGLAGELSDSYDRLDALTTDDPATDVRAVFSWSYRALAPSAARLFRLLGLHPGPDISAAAAASLAGLPPPDVRPLLGELARANLIVQAVPGRYTVHDLLRAYATGLVHTADSDRPRELATRRMLDHYVHTAHAAARLLNPTRDPIPLTAAEAGTTPETITDHGRAMAWLTAEHAVLLAAIDRATGGFDLHAWQLAWTVTDYLERQCHWRAWAATQQTALDAARRLADPLMQARAHRSLGGAHTWLGHFEDAHLHLQNALDLYLQIGDRAGQANTHANLALLCQQRQRYDEALHQAEQALDLFRAVDHRPGQADMLNATGWFHAKLGNHPQALARCEQALPLLHELGDRWGEAGTWDSLGYAHHHLGHHTQAIACFQHALDLFRDLGDRYYEADALTHIGDTHRAAGDEDGARTAWRHALTILDKLGHHNADEIRTKLTAINTRDPDHGETNHDA